MNLLTLPDSLRRIKIAAAGIAAAASAALANANAALKPPPCIAGMTWAVSVRIKSAAIRINDSTRTECSTAGVVLSKNVPVDDGIPRMRKSFIL